MKNNGEFTHSTSYILKDNGLSCFVPPCFSWDVLDSATRAKVMTASEVDLSRLNLTLEANHALLNSLAKGSLVVEGHLIRLKASPPTNQEGIRFVVEKVVKSSHSEEEREP